MEHCRQNHFVEGAKELGLGAVFAGLLTVLTWQGVHILFATLRNIAYFLAH